MNQRYPPPSARMGQIQRAAPVAMPLEVESAPVEKDLAKPVLAKPVPEYSNKMLKRELLELAKVAGLDVSGGNTKAKICAALNEHYGVDG